MAPRAITPSLMLLIMLFLVELLFARTLRADTSDMFIMLTAAGRVLLAGLLMTHMLLSRFFASETRTVAVHVHNRTVFVLLCVFMAVAANAAVIGLFSQHAAKFVIGDWVKFTLFPLVALIMYWTVSSREVFMRLSRAVVCLYFVFLLKDLIFYAAVHDIHTRTISIYLYPFMPFLALFLIREGEDGRGMKLLFIALLAVYPVLVWYSQSLSLLLQTAILAFGGLFYQWLVRERTAARKLLIAFALLAAGASVTLALSQVQWAKWAGFFSYDWYLTRKFYFLLGEGFTVEMLELIGGDRVAHIVAVLNYYAEHPLHLLWGQGMGGLIRVESVAGLEDRLWKPVNHFVEGGYAEIFLRTGVPGLLAYMGIFISLLVQGLRVARQSLIGSLAAAYATYVLLFSSFNMNIINEGFGSVYMASLLLAGVFSYPVTSRSDQGSLRGDDLAASSHPGPDRGAGVSSCLPALPLLMLMVAPLPAAAFAPVPVSAPPGAWEFKESLSDEFNGPALDEKKWNSRVPSWADWTWDAANVGVKNGLLVITTSYSPHARNNRTIFHRSGIIEHADQMIMYGYFEARIKGAPVFPGISPAFWARGKEPSLWTEIDFVEITQNRRSRHLLDFNTHIFRHPGKPDLQEKKPLREKRSWQAPWDPAADFHVYGCKWDEQTIEWFVDGRLVASRANDYWHQPMLVRLSQGLRFPLRGSPNPAGLPAAMQVDYIRIWQRQAEDHLDTKLN